MENITRLSKANQPYKRRIPNGLTYKESVPEKGGKS
jgi:hypothetical protein